MVRAPAGFAAAYIRHSIPYFTWKGWLGRKYAPPLSLRFFLIGLVNKSPDYSGAFIILRTNIPKLKAYGSSQFFSHDTGLIRYRRHDIYQRFRERSGLSCDAHSCETYCRQILGRPYGEYGANMADSGIWSNSMDWPRGTTINPPHSS